MSEFLRTRKPLTLIAAALSGLALSGCGVSEFTNGGDKTINVGVACAPREILRIITINTGWGGGYLTVSCEDSKDGYHAPLALKIPGIDDGSPIKPNFLISTTVNNYGANYWTLQASASHDPSSDTPQSQTISFENEDAIKAVAIKEIMPSS